MYSKVNFCLPAKMYDAIKELSEQDGISVSEHMRRSLTEYLNKFGYKPPVLGEASEKEVKYAIEP